jgi:hypothetical protein
MVTPCNLNSGSARIIDHHKRTELSFPVNCSSSFAVTCPSSSSFSTMTARRSHGLRRRCPSDQICLLRRRWTWLGLRLPRCQARPRHDWNWLLMASWDLTVPCLTVLQQNVYVSIYYNLPPYLLILKLAAERKCVQLS